MNYINIKKTALHNIKYIMIITQDFTQPKLFIVYFIFLQLCLENTKYFSNE